MHSKSLTESIDTEVDKTSEVLPRILVIDDTPANLVAMKVILKGVAAEIITADSGNTGLACALERNIALILLDVNMPEMDGFQVAELLGELEETRSIPIIFVTALHQSENFRMQGYDSGAIDYIEKPINTSILLSKTRIFLKMWKLGFDMQQEIQRRMALEQANEHLAQHDMLTRLPNRRQLHTELDKMIARVSRYDDSFAVLFLDLDGFKKINDELGHDAGDYFLQEISSRLKQALRNTDVIARYGGDEFVILLSDLTDSLALTGKLKILTAIVSKPQEWQGKLMKAGASIGIAICPDHGVDRKTLLSRADKAMYSAKKAGRNTFRFFTEELNVRLERRLDIENYLLAAQQNNELHLHYQPIVNVGTGKPVGAEALMRWHSAVLGDVSPDEFIPVAESCGLIHELGIWVVQQILSSLKTYPEISMAINTSPLQFNSDLLFDELKQHIDSGAINPDRFVVEITESILLDDSDQSEARLNNIRSLGIELSIDDFGTGYSALSYLKRFPVSHLKIDRSFIAGIPDDRESIALVEAIIAMSHALGMSVIAEGVETLEQWQFLQKVGCDKAQGYYFSRPLSSDDFSTYLGQPNENI